MKKYTNNSIDNNSIKDIETEKVDNEENNKLTMISKFK